jgi:3-hydroxybutyryl-CoA dehydrogenase
MHFWKKESPFLKESKMKVGVLGCGAMGSGIAQIAATNGHAVVLVDNNEEALVKSAIKLKKILTRLVEKEKIDQATADTIIGRIEFTSDNQQFAECGILIEAIVERLDVKQAVFANLENIVSDDCILATNTSSLSVASIAASCEKAERVIGIHFFNPAPLMPLVEIIPAVQTSEETKNIARNLIDTWGKVTVLTKDTPGFIVNRVARPFYGEALRIYEEGMADFATIDWAMTELGGFRMGPFTLMDFIGNDINYSVTESVFAAFYFDPRYKPSLTQKRHSEAGWYGRKSGRGYYNYAEDAVKPEPNTDPVLGQQIVDRMVAMLINEAVDALFLNIATAEDLDLAMTKGVNYPKGLLAWADEIGLETVLNRLEDLQDLYGEDRYRPSPLMKRMVKEQKSVFADAV